MFISEVEIKNFKSFNDVSVKLNNFNSLVGACASGKSNFMELFKFIKDISQDLQTGLNLHGDSFIQNNVLKNTVPSCIRLCIDDIDDFTVYGEDNEFKIDYNSIEYELCINFEGFELNLIKEAVRFNFKIYKKDTVVSQNSLIVKNDNGNIRACFSEDENMVDLEFLVPKSLLRIVGDNFNKKQKLLINSALSSIPISWIDYIKEIELYNFNPIFCKINNNGSNLLLESGENLSNFLDNILSNEKNKKEFLNLISYLLPYIEDISVNKLPDNKKIFTLIEQYSQTPIFSPFVSDGSVNIIALISALYFSGKNILLIEEPERNIHPSLFIKLVGMMKELSLNKQIVITTHSPEILDYCELEDIYLIYRDENGFSNITKPEDNQEVKEFVEELGIGQVFLNNYLRL